MALTSSDETDLLLPLFGGIDEAPAFSTFLARMQRRTGTRHVMIAMDDDLTDPVARAVLPPNISSLHVPRPFRVYSLGELDELESNFAQRRADLRNRNGLSDARIVRIPVGDRRSCWLLLARDRPCTAADSALLSSVAPYVQTVLAAREKIARERAIGTLASEGMRRAGSGWITFDAQARVVDFAPAIGHFLSRATGATPQQGERLRGILPAAERSLAQLASAASHDRGTQASALVLIGEPRLEAIIEAIEPDRSPVAIVAWCRHGAAASAARQSRLAELHDLPPREAELAIALADGASIGEAAAAMGLTVETARNYSKRLYARLDVTGQAQLVGKVLRSSAVLA